ncbi:MAG: chorismate mutase [Hyphomonadaceae bacterium]
MDSSQARPADALEAARAEIDRIDSALLDLVAQRMAAADAVAAAKPPGGLPFRPAREVQALRRLLAAAGDRIEPELVMELWRSLMAANARRQKIVDVVVGVGGGQDPLRYFDLARRHFGARTRIHRVDDPRAALNRATDSESIVAVLPWPNKTGAGMWWHILTESRYHRLQIIAALPMRGAEEPEAAIVAAGAPLEPAGGDCTFAMAFDRHYKVARALAEANMQGVEIARADNKVLLRLDGFLAPEDPRGGLLIRAGLDQFRVVGSFARV